VLDDDDFKERDLLGVGDVPFSIAKAPCMKRVSKEAQMQSYKSRPTAR
jgi:hypothetical protein